MRNKIHRFGYDQRYPDGRSITVLIPDQTRVPTNCSWVKILVKTGYRELSTTVAALKRAKFDSAKHFQNSKLGTEIHGLICVL